MARKKDRSVQGPKRLNDKGDDMKEKKQRKSQSNAVVDAFAEAAQDALVEKIADRMMATIKPRVVKTVEDRVKDMILGVMHSSSSSFLVCDHRDDNWIRVTQDAREKISAAINRQFELEVQSMLFRKADELKKDAQGIIDDYLNRSKIGQGSWVFELIREQIASFIGRKMAAAFKTGDQPAPENKD